MNQLSLKEEMSEEVKRILEAYRKNLDAEFGKYEKYALFWIEKSETFSKIAHNANQIFESRSDKSELALLSSIIAMQSEIQLYLANSSLANSRDLKDLAYISIEVPLQVAVRILSCLVEAIPKASLETRKMFEEKLGDFEKELENLKNRKEIITLEGREDIIKTIEKIEKSIEEADKALKKVVV